MPKKISETKRLTAYFMNAPLDAAKASLDMCQAIVEEREGQETSKPAAAPRKRRQAAEGTSSGDQGSQS